MSIVTVRPTRGIPPVAWAAAGFAALLAVPLLIRYGAPGSEPYGIEHYFPGRRVEWGWAGTQDCQEGKWYEEARKNGPAICFLYDDDPEPKCWQIFREGKGLRATFLNDGQSTILYELVDKPGSLVCGGFTS